MFTWLRVLLLDERVRDKSWPLVLLIFLSNNHHAIHTPKYALLCTVCNVCFARVGMCKLLLHIPICTYRVSNAHVLCALNTRYVQIAVTHTDLQILSVQCTCAVCIAHLVCANCCCCNLHNSHMVQEVVSCATYCGHCVNCCCYSAKCALHMLVLCT